MKFNSLLEDRLLVILWMVDHIICGTTQLERDINGI